jgi:gas vesicle protein
MRAWSYLEDTPKRIRTSMKEAKRLHKESSNVLQDISGKIPEDCKKLLDNLEEHIKSNSIQEESP